MLFLRVSDLTRKGFVREALSELCQPLSIPRRAPVASSSGELTHTLELTLSGFY
jgi:hypothetical protein